MAEKKTYVLIPTLIQYLGYALLTLSVTVAPNGWLFALGLIITLPFLISMLIPSIVTYLNIKNVQRHPEKYQTKIEFDAEDRLTSIKWNRI